MRISDSIERFIKQMLGEDSPEVELQRNELADYFGCAPSQINYVLATRFSPDQGYLTESRRGGGGYIRIVRVLPDDRQQLMMLFRDRIGDSLSEEDAGRIISALKERGVISEEEGALMAAAVGSRAMSVPVSLEVKAALRARMMKSMLLTLVNRRQS